MEKVIIYVVVVIGILLLMGFTVKKIQTRSDQKSKEIPKDIIDKLKVDYPKEDEYKEAISVINHVKNDLLNVGWIQLSRAIIIIANGDVSKMKEIIEEKYYGDPRDVIMEMMRIPGNKNDHGMTPFELD